MKTLQSAAISLLSLLSVPNAHTEIFLYHLKEMYLFTSSRLAWTNVKGTAFMFRPQWPGLIAVFSDLLSAEWWVVRKLLSTMTASHGPSLTIHDEWQATVFIFLTCKHRVSPFLWNLLKFSKYIKKNVISIGITCKSRTKSGFCCEKLFIRAVSRINISRNCEKNKTNLEMKKIRSFAIPL